MTGHPGADLTLISVISIIIVDTHEMEQDCSTIAPAKKGC